MCVRWCDNLYVSDSVKDKKDTFINRINNHKLCFETYIITLPSNPSNLLDIYNANTLLQPYYQRQDMTAVGLALGKDEAYEVVRRIVADMYSSAQGFDVLKFFNIRQ